MRILLAIIPLLVALPGAAYAVDILINNGDDCSNPGNVIDDNTYQNDNVYVRNVGCPPGWPAVFPYDPCPSPGAPTEVCVVTGGIMGALFGYDSSTIEMSGGTVGLLDPSDSSIVTISDGTVDYLNAWGSSIVAISGGAVAGTLNSLESSTITIRGGDVGSSWALDSSTITVVGRDFAVDDVPVPYGDLTVHSGTLTGTLASGDPVNIVFYQGGDPYTGTITLAPPLPVLPKWGYLALAGGLMVVGAVVMRRRRA